MADAAERRQLTVMFCDLVGSTALSARLDPEDMREVIRAYQDACSGAVARYDGFVAKFMGDGVLAYFGFPRAHEEDAERAVRAGLDIVAAVAKLETRANESSRSASASPRGSSWSATLLDRALRKNRPSSAKRPIWQRGCRRSPSRAAVVIAESTRRLLGGAFELEPLGPQSPERLRRAGSRLGGPSRGGERQPLRGVAVATLDALRRARA